MNSPRLLFAAPASGSGKTTIVCGLLRALKNRGTRVRAFKCGPDFIDPLFHETVVGVPSGTMDLFFSSEDQLKGLFYRHAAGADLCLMEGVMGYYDGLGAATDQASSYAVARALDAPVVLIVDSRGQSLSALATLEGFLRFRTDSRIRGVIFNRMSKGVYDALKPEVEKLGLRPLGYVPRVPEAMIESRHLGLVTPGEIEDLGHKLDTLAALLEQTVDLEALLTLAAEAPALVVPPAPPLPAMPRTRIAVARDEAFCFLYRDNLELLQDYGAELRFFSPLHDVALPEETQGLILPGGYPELYAQALYENESMRLSIAEAIQRGLPCLAECGGFLYLHRELEDMDGRFWPMAGVLDAKAYRTPRLGRFGYITLTAKTDTAFLPAGENVRGHEFHYYESENYGDALHARKPTGNRGWDCSHSRGNLLMGFPHLYYPSNPKLVERFLRACAKEV
jgi:cobyrinic acid a,c-diamide synthase